jgi:DNA-binding NtrC family response regulator
MEHSILVVEDDELLASNIQTYLERRDFEARVCHSAEDALKLLQNWRPDVVLTDNSLPGMSGHELINALKESAPDLKLIMMTGYGNIEDAVTAMKEGAFHYLTKPVALPELKLLLDKALAAERLERTLSFYQDRDAKHSGLQALIGDSPAMMQVKGVVTQLLDAERRMTSSDLPPVLVEGDTGTGKELIARALHFDGPRAKGPFVEFNCASIPAHLIEAELFGHEKGAFTDAKDRRTGLVEAADGGTLFLDEVGEMDLLLQAKLLKLLEDRTVRRIGSVKERKVDLRIISATNCNLEQMVQQGKSVVTCFSACASSPSRCRVCRLGATTSSVWRGISCSCTASAMARQTCISASSPKTCYAVTAGRGTSANCATCWSRQSC